MGEFNRGRRRIVLALLVAVLALLAIGPLAAVGYGRAVDRAKADTEAWADTKLDDTFVWFRTGEGQPHDNTWNVNVRDGWSNPFGETWTEPPLVALATPAVEEGTTVQEYDFNGRWLAAGRWAGGEEAVLTVVSRDDEDAAIATARWRWTAIAAGMTALAGGLAWLGLGRLRGPVDRARDLNRDFIADAAHELRTPLAIIQASAGHALARDRSGDEYRESLTEILDATERAGSSVGELLEFARLESGQGSLRLAPLRLDLLVEEVAASIRVEGVVVEALAGEAVVVEADYNLIRQVVDNIARNAAARSTKVTLGTFLEGRQARIEIGDNGPGFDPGIIDHVFERFRPGDRSGAVGLGMAIARTIVELHGGTCEAANRSIAVASAPDDQPGTVTAGGDRESGGGLVTVRLPYKA